jgi:hypothetical protein
MLSDKEIKSFFGASKQHLDGEGFTKKIISQLNLIHCRAYKKIDKK